MTLYKLAIQTFLDLKKRWKSWRYGLHTPLPHLRHVRRTPSPLLATSLERRGNFHPSNHYFLLYKYQWLYNQQSQVSPKPLNYATDTRRHWSYLLQTRITPLSVCVKHTPSTNITHASNCGYSKKPLEI